MICTHQNISVMKTNEKMRTRSRLKGTKKVTTKCRLRTWTEAKVALR